MFEIKKEGNFSREERLLYNIWQELIRLNSSQVKDKVDDLPIVKKDESKTNAKTFKCKVCDMEYENKGQLLACAKKHNKESDNSVRTNNDSVSEGSKGNTK